MTNPTDKQIDEAEADFNEIKNVFALDSKKTFKWVLKHIRTILSALEMAKADRWNNLDDWHDDDSSALFIFFKNIDGNYEYWDTLFTSPASSDFPDTEANNLWCTWKAIDTRFELPTTPKESGSFNEAVIENADRELLKDKF